MKATLRASYKLDAKERHGTVAQNRRLVEQESPAAANSLREALEQWFTIIVWEFRRRCTVTRPRPI
jgi:hypothetical protein